MPISLATMFCTPQDVWDALSVEGVDLRLDDRNLASGQIIEVVTAAATGATSITILTLPVSLLKGAKLTFDMAGMSVPVIITLTAAAIIGATSISVEALSADIAAGAQARDSGVNAATGARLVVACRKGTTKVKLYCNQRYDDSQLVVCGSACDWATKVACHWLCQRRAQGCPKSVLADYKEVVDELRQVQSGELALEDIGTRGVDWPQIVNVTVNPAYDGMRARVQPNISEGTPTNFPNYVDWNSAALLSF